MMKLSNYAKIFKALSNEQRLKIFLMIYQKCCQGESGVELSELKFNEATCCSEGIEKAFSAVCECLKLSKSTISHHFKELQNAGLISCMREGQTYRCKVNQDTINELREFMG